MQSVPSALTSSPRPAHSAEDWMPCESCGEPTELFRDHEDALDCSDDIMADLRQPLI